MNLLDSPLRVLNDHALPLRLRERLRDGRVATRHEPDDGPPGRSTLDRNDVCSRAPTPHFVPAAGEATLITVLAVAEQLYEQIAIALAHSGLSFARYELLEHLRRANGPLSLAALAGRVGCARSTTTHVIERLEAERLVERVHDNGFGVNVQLTAGRVRADLGGDAMERVCARFAASLSAPEWAELGRLLTRIP